jgi:hypothetical protein
VSVSETTVMPIEVIASRASWMRRARTKATSVSLYGACREKRLLALLICCFDVIDCAIVMAVGSLEQADQHTRVEDQRSPSSRSFSSSSSL